MSLFRRIIAWGWKLTLVLCLLTLIQVFSLRFANPPFTGVMVWHWIHNRDAITDVRLRDTWRPLNQISPHLRKAVLAGEDQRFLVHHGFDFTEITQALKDILRDRGFRGASTISMQVARTVFLWPKRTWVRKLVEAYYTSLIEILWTKRRILEIYLNTVDWGERIMGAEAASRRYFGVASLLLSPSQAALLAAILPNPHDWSPTHPSAHVLRRQAKILQDMQKMPLLSSLFRNQGLRRELQVAFNPRQEYKS